MAASPIPIKIWYDPEADFLEVLFSAEAGFMQETNNEFVMERVNEHGDILGFTVMQARHASQTAPLIAELV
jgi:uncharacterized protein YuzE